MDLKTKRSCTRACVTSIVRLKYIVTFGNSTDQTCAQIFSINSIGSINNVQKSDPISVDNALPAIWSFLEICMAIICSCLPSIRVLFSRWFPGIFDLSTTPSSNANGNSNKLYFSPFSSSNPQASPSDQAGHSYIESIITRDNDQQEPDDKIVETKVWINPHFDGEGNVVQFQEAQQPRDYSPPSSHSSGPFALEGPRVSDEVDTSAEEDGIALQNVEPRVTKVRRTQSADRIQRGRAPSALPSVANRGSWSVIH